MKNRVQNGLPSESVTFNMTPCVTLVFGRDLATCGVALVLSALVFMSSASANPGQLYREAEKLNNQEKVKQVIGNLASMQNALKFTLQELQSSYDKKDVIQTNCIKDKLSTVKGLLRISEEAEVNLRESVVTDQVDIVNTEFVKIQMAAERVRDLRSQVANCAKEVNDPLLNNNQQKSKPEISDKAVQAFEPTSDENTIIIYDPIASERPEAISPSE